MKIFHYFFIVFVFLYAIPHAAHALDVISMKTTPATPGVSAEVTITLESFTTPLSTSRIAWFINGEAVSEGPGMTRFTTRTGAFGEVVRVLAVIITPDGRRIDKSLDISPVEIDLLWEADGYVPPFYRGKSLPTTGGKVKMVAIPRFNSKESSPANYVYTWSIDRTKEVGGGLGKSSATVLAPKEGLSVNIGVMVSSLRGPQRGSRNIDIRGVAPMVRFYGVEPLLGTNYAQALLGTGNVTLSAEGSMVRAVPYFMNSVDRTNGKLKYAWIVGGVPVPNTTNVEKVEIAGEPGGNGKEVRVSIQNLANLLQSVSGKTTVQFQ